MSTLREPFAILGDAVSPAAMLFGLTLTAATVRAERVAVLTRTRAGRRTLTVHHPDGGKERVRVAWDMNNPALYGPATLTRETSKP